MFVRTKRNKEGRIYLQVAETYREGKRSRQRILCTLGRLDILQSTGKLDNLLRSAVRFSEKLAIVEACKNTERTAANTVKIGPALVFEKLWKTSGIAKVLERLTQERNYAFPLERAIFLTVLHRLVCSGSDRSAEHWKEGYRIRGTKEVSLHHLYRAMAWLGEPLKDQDDATPFTPRCTKDRIEEELFGQRRDLFSGFDVVFFDTTSIYFEGEGGQTLGQRGHSKDHRPDLRQLVVGVVLDNDGNPVCCELWPGNTADVRTLLPIVNRLRRRFGIRQVCIVADRGMISQGTVEQLENPEYNMRYILGVRMRKEKLIREKVLSRAGRFRQIILTRKGKSQPLRLKIKEVRVDQRRYIVCLNEEEAKKDQADREAIIESLRAKLRQGDKQLVGNKGYRRYVRSEGQRFTIDEERVKEESRYDGKWVLRTNTALSPEDVALKYKQLWAVEDIFRTMKSILETRPIYHKCDETIRGHVFCSVLALILRKELQDCLETRGWGEVEWQDIVRDLDNLHEIEERFGNKRFILREECRGVAGKVIQAAGAALPPTIREA